MFAVIPPHARIWIATSFPFSKGTRYPYAVELAKGADYYVENDGPAGLIHVAGFRNERPSILRAVALLEYAGVIRGCMTSNGSSIWDAERTLRVLRCYLGALNAPPNYCHTPYNSPFCVLQLGNPPILLPCKLIEGYFIQNWHTTGTVNEQLQSAAVESGCEWCPMWKPILANPFNTPPSSNNTSRKILK